MTQEADVKGIVNVTVWQMALAGGLLAASAGIASAQSYELIEAAKQEGKLATMALAEDWCGYDALKDGFETKYGIEIVGLNANASSSEQLEALRADKDRDVKEGPDVVDVTIAVAQQAADAGLTQPYRVATWDTIPDDLKHPSGLWTGDYFGVMAFEVNADVVKKLPEDWADLLTPEYSKSVALAGNPNASVQALQGVLAAGLAKGQGDVAKAAELGMEYFAELNANGNFLPVAGSAATVADKSTPILVRWDYLALKDRDALKADGPKVAVVVPKTGVVGGAFAQAISANAPHPNAAKLWLEYLYSDEGQLAWLKAYCHPVRFKDLTASGKVPKEIEETLPPAAAYDGAVFLSPADQAAAGNAISEQWDATVGAEVTR
ncbi:MAG: extracellular solute-binding protein [Rhizobiales bacterium]|nr:extracellular solute-binding protein [Hyphomicrobiales bacterium]